MENEEKRVLIVEDNKNFVADNIDPILKNMEFKFHSRWINNALEAIRALENGSWNLVILDLGIFESKEGESLGAKTRYGMSVWNKIKELNEKSEKEICVVVLSGNYDDEETRSLIEGHGWSAGIGKSNVPDELPGAIKRAFEIKKISKNIEYVGFSKELLGELWKVDRSIHNHLETRVLASYRNKEFSDVIISARQLLYCIRGGFADQNFNSGKFLSDEVYPDDVGKPFDFLSDKGVRPVDRIFAQCLVDVRNKFKGDQRYKPGIDDAAAVMQLLVPIVSAYVNFKKGVK